MNSIIEARIRKRLSAFLPTTCTIQHRVQVVGALGDTANGWEIVAADVPCRLISYLSNTKQAAVVDDRLALVEAWRLIVPVGTALAPEQRVTIGGEIYVIVSVIDEWSDAMDAQAIIVRDGVGQ